MSVANTESAAAVADPLAQAPKREPLTHGRVSTGKRRAVSAPSGQYERLENDAYLTRDAALFMDGLLDGVPDIAEIARNGGVSFDPAAGAGHLVAECKARGFDAHGSELHQYTEPMVGGIRQRDLFELESLEGVDAVITNLPFAARPGTARPEQDFMLEHLLPLSVAAGCWFATIVRAPWHLAATERVGRRMLVHKNPYFYAIVTLPRRPLWFDKAESPMVEYVWAVWSPTRRKSPHPFVIYPQ